MSALIPALIKLLLSKRGGGGGGGRSAKPPMSENEKWAKHFASQVGATRKSSGSEDWPVPPDEEFDDVRPSRKR